MVKQEVNNSGSGFFGVLTFSGAAAASYLFCTAERRKEWYDIVLDYCHHKRTALPPARGLEAVRLALRGLRR